jgi:hypothetical protein
MDHQFNFALLGGGAGPTQQGAGASLGFGLVIPEPATSVSLGALGIICALGVVRGRHV